MKLLTFLILLIGIYISPQAQSIHVKVSVDATDPSLKNRLLSKLQTELRSKSAVAITQTNPDFLISVGTAEIRSNNKLVGLSMSTILSQKVITKDNKITFEVLKSIVSSINLTEIESKCVELASGFDVEYFDKLRKQ